MPAHVDETTKQAKETYPKGTPKSFVNPSGQLSTFEQKQVAKEAWDRQEDKSLTWDELDGTEQRRYYDVSVDIWQRGGATSGFEQKVAEVKNEYGAGTFTLEPPPPELMPLTEYERRELIEKAEKDEKRVLTEPEKNKLIQEEEAKRAGKAQPVAPNAKATPKS